MPFTPCILAENLTNSPLFAEYSTENIEPYLPNGIHYLQQINCFSGANNAGKSRLLRHLFQSVGTNNLLFNIQDTLIPTSAELKHIFDSLNKDEGNENSDYNEFYNNLKNVLNPENYINTNTKKIYSLYRYLYLLRSDEKKVSDLQLILESKSIIVQNIINEATNNKNNLNFDINHLKTAQEEITNIKNIALSYINNNRPTVSDCYAISNTIKLQTTLIYIKKYDSETNKLLSLFKDNGMLYITFARDIQETLKICAKVDNDIQLNINKIFTTINAIEKNTENYLRGHLGVFVSNWNNMFKSSNPKLNKLYIPILRGTRPFDKKKTDVYAVRTMKDYGIDEKHIFTGLSLYNELRAHLLGTHTKRELIQKFENFLSESFFDDKKITLTPNIDYDVVYIKIGDQEDKPIYDLGDGIQALIILTFPLFLRKDEPHMIFIEEPEAHLHPAWQRFFLATIKQYFGKHQFFFTTHSSIFLSEPTASLYAINRSSADDKKIISYIDGSTQDLLDELGYKASDLLQANYIIWVEGTSDSTYIKSFINAYDSTLIYGVDYVIMWYGGEQIRKIVDDELKTINQLNPNFAIILDSDFTKPKGCSLKEYKKNAQILCDQMNKFCWITKVREIENLIPTDIWYKACIAYTNQKENKNLSLNDFSVIKNPYNDDKYDDRTGDNTRISVIHGINKNSEELAFPCKDKVPMAKSVTSIFPKNKADLELVPELFENIENLVAAIKSSTKSALQEK